MDNEKNNKRKTIVSVTSLILLLILVIGITYAVFTFNGYGTETNKLSTGVIEMIFTENDESGFALSNLSPMSDEQGKAIADDLSFHFSIQSKATGHKGVNYEIVAVKQDLDDGILQLDNDDVRIFLEKEIIPEGTVISQDYVHVYYPAYEPTGFIPISQNSRYADLDDNTDATNAKEGDMILERANINKDTLVNYRLKMWVNYNHILDSNDQPKKGFKIKINAYGTDRQDDLEYKDASGANAPELKGDMIPVIYDVGGKSWVKADKTGEWYNYGKQMWANVVTIADEEKRKDYVNAVPGTKIDMEQVNTMWVWIPRYAYAIKKNGNTNLGHLLKGNDGNLLEGETNRTLTAALPGAIDIKFISTDSTPFGAGNYDVELTDGHLYTPSSFCWGDTCDTTHEETRHASGNKELAGIWVSKFELTGSISDPGSVPNRDALRGQTIGTLFNAIRTELQNNGSTKYGLSGNYDAHMIKNTEWGAFAYLSQSIYGKYGNKNYTGVDKEIYINNYYNTLNGSETKTGCSSGSPNAQSSARCLYEYDDLENGKGVGASTTGTIYGVYDVSGGAWERTMGYFDGGNLTKSGFTALPTEKRYYNLYSSTVTSIKGDATTETAGFYWDYNTYITSYVPWWNRGAGGSHTHNAGAFSFNYCEGEAGVVDGGRMIIVTA